MSWLHQQRNVTTQFDGVNMNFKVNAQVLLIWGFKAETCEGILVLFKTCQSVAGPLKGLNLNFLQWAQQAVWQKETIPNYMELFLSSHIRSQ